MFRLYLDLEKAVKPPKAPSGASAGGEGSGTPKAGPKKQKKPSAKDKFANPEYYDAKKYPGNPADYGFEQIPGSKTWAREKGSGPGRPEAGSSKKKEAKPKAKVSITKKPKVGGSKSPKAKVSAKVADSMKDQADTVKDSPALDSEETVKDAKATKRPSAKAKPKAKPVREAQSPVEEATVKDSPAIDVEDTVKDAPAEETTVKDSPALDSEDTIKDAPAEGASSEGETTEEAKAESDEGVEKDAPEEKKQSEEERLANLSHTERLKELHFKNSAKRTISDIDSVLMNNPNLSEEERKELGALKDAYSTYANQEGGIPKEMYKEHKDLEVYRKEFVSLYMKDTKQAERTPGPASARPSTQSESKPKKERGVNFLAMFRAGQAAGSQAGAAAATIHGAGALGSMAVNYGVSGVGMAGHKLLSPLQPGDPAAPKQPGAPTSPPKETKPTQPAGDAAATTTGKTTEVAQASLGKSFGLYLDLSKSVNIPNTSVSTPTPEKAKKQYEESYKKRPVGVDNETTPVDESDRGSAWSKKSVEEDEEDKENPKDILKSITAMSKAYRSVAAPTDLETDFLLNVVKADPSQVYSGEIVIKGQLRHRFNEWAHNRLRGSLSELETKV